MPRFQARRGTAAQWSAANPVLAIGEPFFETDTGMGGYGDGATPYRRLFKFKMGMAQSFSAFDDFNRSAQDLESSPNWSCYTRYGSGEHAEVSSQNRVVRSGNPGNRDWADSAFWVPACDYLNQWVQVDIPANNLSGTSAFADTPKPGVVLRSVNTGESWTANNGTSTTVRPPALFGTFSTTGWFIYLANPGYYTDSASFRTLLQSGSGSFPEGGTARMEITADDVVTLKYNGAVVWSGSIAGSGVSRAIGTRIGLAPSRNGNAAVDNFAGGVL